jgi:hypothetical protein
MPTVRPPQRTLISGLGVAGSVLAAVVLAFAVTSGIVAYSLSSVDPVPRLSGALVLDPLRTAVIAAKPLVLRPARPVARRRASAAAGAGPAAAVATVRNGLSLHTGDLPVTVSDPQDGGNADRPAASTQPAPDHLLEPAGDAVGATGHAVGATTDSLTTITTAVAARTEPLASIVAAVVDATTEALRTTVDRTGKVVGRLLAGPPPR